VSIEVLYYASTLK